MTPSTGQNKKSVLSSAAMQSPFPVLILQHPQEPSKHLGTAHLIESIAGATRKVGLSWASLSKALGTQTPPKGWVVLYLGSAPTKDQPAGLYTVHNKIDLYPYQDPPRGIVLLDGTWSQSKTLWWRNPWLLKLIRCVVVPEARSLYKSLRKEPRPECLSTLEALASTYKFLGHTEIAESLMQSFSNLLRTK